MLSHEQQPGFCIPLCCIETPGLMPVCPHTPCAIAIGTGAAGGWPPILVVEHPGGIKAHGDRAVMLDLNGKKVRVKRGHGSTTTLHPLH